MRVGAESSNRGGFTLIEALVAMVLSTVVLMLVTSVFLVQNYFYSDAMKRSGLHESVRGATKLISSDLRGELIRPPISSGPGCANRIPVFDPQEPPGEDAGSRHHHRSASESTDGGGRRRHRPRPSRAIQKVVEAVGVPWSVLSDREFPVDYEGVLPNFGSLEPGSFPVIRVTGDFFPTAAESGQGVLIVTGDFGIPANSGWQWKGIVMTGGLSDFGPEANFLLEGMLVAGQGLPMNNWDMDNGRILYHSCYVSWAGASLAHLSAVNGGWWEER